MRLIGRERELATLETCLSAALDGQPQLVLCQGEPGIGKTRLSEELAARAAAQGVLVVWGLAADSSSAPPCWPWWQVLRVLAEHTDLVAIAHRRQLDADLAGLHRTSSRPTVAPRSPARRSKTASASSTRCR